MSVSNSSEVVLVTGAAGKTGRAILAAMLAAGLVPRALVRGPRQRLAIEALGVAQVVAGDLMEDGAVAAAARGAHAVYHICPNVHPDEVGIGRRVLAAAAKAGVERFVFHSVLHPQAEAMPHHWAKLRVEEMVFESGLDFTILQPAPYMQNVLGQWEQIAATGVFAVPYATTARIAMVDLEDVATAAVRVLKERGHAGATYELCGPDRLDQTEIAALLGRHLDRPVHAEVLALEDWARGVEFSPGSYRYETLVKMFRYYERHGMAGNHRVLEHLLGRTPARLEAVVARHHGASAAS